MRPCDSARTHSECQFWASPRTLIACVLRSTVCVVTCALAPRFPLLSDCLFDVHFVSFFLSRWGFERMTHLPFFRCPMFTQCNVTCVCWTKGCCVSTVLTKKLCRSFGLTRLVLNHPTTTRTGIRSRGEMSCSHALHLFSVRIWDARGRRDGHSVEEKR